MSTTQDDAFNITLATAAERLQQYHQERQSERRAVEASTADETQRDRRPQPPDASTPAVGADRGGQSARQRRSRSPSPDAGATYASVLIGLFTHPLTGEINTIVTQRASHMKSHGGECALPGGKRDGDETEVMTALREAEEEIGLQRSSVKHLATCDWAWSKAGHKVYPICALIPPPDIALAHAHSAADDQPIADKRHTNQTFTPRLSVDEVDSMFIVPLHLFLKSDIHTSQQMIWRGEPFQLHYFNHTTTEYLTAGDTKQPAATPEPRTFKCWGLTAYFLIEAAMLVYQREPAFEMTPRFRAAKFRQRDRRKDTSPIRMATDADKLKLNVQQQSNGDTHARSPTQDSKL